VDDLAGQIQDCGVVVQDEFGVGGQYDSVQLAGASTARPAPENRVARPGRP